MNGDPVPAAPSQRRLQFLLPAHKDDIAAVLLRGQNGALHGRLGGVISAHGVKNDLHDCRSSSIRGRSVSSRSSARRETAV